MVIEELEKPAGSWCHHRLTGYAPCGIYGSHPSSCKSFVCQWLIEPLLDDRLRPDISKVVLVADDRDRLIAYCDTNNPLAWRREPMFSILKQQAAATWMTKHHVYAKAGPRMWLITPIAEIDLGLVDDRSPMDVRMFPDGRATVRVLPPIPEDADVEEHLAALNMAAGRP